MARQVVITDDLEDHPTHRGSRTASMVRNLRLTSLRRTRRSSGMHSLPSSRGAVLSSGKQLYQARLAAARGARVALAVAIAVAATSEIFGRGHKHKA
jgi:hypothetical protein